jgi:hypothetical protein
MSHALLPIADSTVANEVTLIIPLGLLLLTLLWLGWQLARAHDRSR